MEQEERLCAEVETVRGFTYLGDSASAGGGCEAAVTAWIRRGWIILKVCCEMLYGRRFLLWLKGAVYKRATKVQQFCMEVRHCA